eukprot:6212069-Pleurochrysis_carterae.AAC.3
MKRNTQALGRESWANAQASACTKAAAKLRHLQWRRGREVTAVNCCERKHCCYLRLSASVESSELSAVCRRECAKQRRHGTPASSGTILEAGVRSCGINAKRGRMLSVAALSLSLILIFAFIIAHTHHVALTIICLERAHPLCCEPRLVSVWLGLRAGCNFGSDWENSPKGLIRDPVRSVACGFVSGTKLGDLLHENVRSLSHSRRPRQ